MTKADLIAQCLTHPGVYEDYPFDDIADAHAWTVMRHIHNKKSFALIFERDGLCINLKCDPIRSDHLRQMFEGITPAYHMNKVHWISVRPDSDVPQDLLEELIGDSFFLTQKGKK